MIDYGNGVCLDRIAREDLPAIRRWRNDYAIWRWCRQRDLIDEASHEAWFSEINKDRSLSMYKIVVGTRPVGVCGLTSIDPWNKRAEFSCYIAPEHQAKGYAREALKAMFTHGFKNLGLNMIWGETFEGNKALDLFKSIGMRVDGARRQFYFKDGRFIDAHLVSVTSQEWHGL